MILALALAQRVAGLTYEALPANAVHWAKVGILDTVGVTLAGSLEPAPRLVAKLNASAGASRLFGTDASAGALEAALVNGTAAHALDFDDANNSMGGHPSVPVLPALFALADAEPVDGRRFLTAYVAGFETECKIARGVNLHHYTKGWHPTATLGTFGAAAACCRLLGLDAAKTATALALAASLASGVKANFGTMTKPLHVGHCARNGLFAALLAREGFTANEGAFEHKQGFLEVFNGAGTYDTAAMLDGWGAPFDIVEPGIAIKQYPCCGATHPALDVALDLARRHAIDPAAIARIHGWIHPRRLEHTNRPDPRSPLDAKFSLQYCLARALVSRTIAIDHFEGSTFMEPAVRRLLPLIDVAGYGTDRFPVDKHFGAEVQVTLADGTIVSGKVEQPLGRTSAVPLPAERLREKFENCAARVLSRPTIAAAMAGIESIEQLADVRTLTTLLVSQQPPKIRARA